VKLYLAMLSPFIYALIGYLFISWCFS